MPHTRRFTCLLSSYVYHTHTQAAQPVDFIKVDAQGLDAIVIASARSRLRQVRRFALEVISDDCDSRGLSASAEPCGGTNFAMLQPLGHPGAGLPGSSGCGMPAVCTRRGTAEACAERGD